MAVDFKLIGERIKKKRKQIGLTQEQLAERIDVTVGYVSQCERGISKINLEKLSEISDVLKCDLSYFVSGCTINGENYLADELIQKFSLLMPKQKKQILEFINIILNS